MYYGSELMVEYNEEAWGLMVKDNLEIPAEKWVVIKTSCSAFDGNAANNLCKGTRIVVPMILTFAMLNVALVLFYSEPSPQDWLVKSRIGVGLLLFMAALIQMVLFAVYQIEETSINATPFVLMTLAMIMCIADMYPMVRKMVFGDNTKYKSVSGMC